MDEKEAEMDWYKRRNNKLLPMALDGFQHKLYSV